MRVYQNNKLVAILEKTSDSGFVLSENKKSGKLSLSKVGRQWELKNARGRFIDLIIADSDIQTLDESMLESIFRKHKRNLKLRDEKLEILADNQEELEKQRIVINLKEKE